MMGIVGFQIKTKKIFNVVGVIIGLKLCQLGLKLWINWF
jgi:hypothetical protein